METKRERAIKAADNLAGLCDVLESMTRDAECLLGSEAQGTISPFNAEVNVAVGEIALLRRRAMIVKSRLHSIVFPRIQEDIKKIAAQVSEAEGRVTEILAMPDMSPEEEVVFKQTNKDKRFVMQALGGADEPSSVQAISELVGFSKERTTAALNLLIADGFVEVSGDGFKVKPRPTDSEAAEPPQ